MAEYYFKYTGPESSKSLVLEHDLHVPFLLKDQCSLYRIFRASSVKRLHRDYTKYVHDLDEFNDKSRELGPQNLPDPVLEVYYHLNFKYNFFNTNHGGETELCPLLNIVADVFKMESIRASTDFKIEFARILQVFAKHPKGNYCIESNYGAIPWNNAILPLLSQDCPEPLVSYSTQLTVTKPPHATSHRVEYLFKVYPRGVVERCVIDTINGVHTTRLSPELIDKFTKHTKLMAPSLNGTACVGKSTMLTRILDRVKSKFPSASVLKISQFGGFKDKDKNDLVGMQCLPVMMHACEVNYTSIADRDPFNNITWRLIMNLLNCKDDDELVETVLESLSTININMIEYMKRCPVFVLVDSGLSENRKRMYSRGKRTRRDAGVIGDLFRCRIFNYVKCQNIVYGLLAFLCDWPVFDVAGQVPIDDSYMEIITNAFVDKCLWNDEHGSAASDNSQVYQYNHGKYPDLCYDMAKSVKAFK